MWLSLKESRTQLLNATNLDRKSGIRGPKTMGEALRPLLMSAGKSSKAVLFEVKCIRGQEQPSRQAIHGASFS
jgi:hypothetical protein